jgi:hypothetical protein
MTIHPRRILPLALVAAISAITAPALADTPLPVKEMSNAEIGALSGLPYLSPTNQAFRMAAAVQVSAHGQGTPQQAVQRSSGAVAAVYRSLPAQASPPPLLPPMPAGASLFDHAQTGDHAQSWATMTADGKPSLYARGYGEFGAEATASWTTSLVVPAGGSREVVLRFVLPPASVAGYTEQQGIARWRSRLRGEVLVNGFPAWSTEAIRLTIDPKVQNNNLSETIVLQQYGHALAFPTNDEDGDAGNDSSAATVNGTSTQRVVHLSLGRFNPGATVDLSMILRASTLTVPAAPNGTDHRCKYSNPAARYYCSRGGVTLNGGSGEPPRIYLVP